MKKCLTFLMAGGKGERLFPLTKDRAKPAVPFGGIYRIVDFTLSNCINSGIRNISVLVQYKSMSLARHIRMGWNVLNAEVEYLDAQIQLISTRHDVVVASYQVLATIGQLSAASLDLASDIYDPEEHLQESRQNWFGIAIHHADGRRELYEAIDADNLPTGLKK